MVSLLLPLIYLAFTSLALPNGLLALMAVMHSRVQTVKTPLR